MQPTLPALPTVHDIDAYLRQQLEPRHGKLGLVQRHKLCYEVLRLGIGLTGEAPFETGRIEAWDVGPIFLNLPLPKRRRRRKPKPQESAGHHE